MVGLVPRRLAKAFKHFPRSKTHNLHCFGCDNSKVISAMDHPPIQTCVLKMNINCENCQKKVKKMLQKIHGVHSINIDANEGKVVVSSTVDPLLFIATLARAGKRAELLSEPAAKPQEMMSNHNEESAARPQEMMCIHNEDSTVEPQANMNNHNKAEHQGKKMQNFTPKEIANLMERDINTRSQLAQLEEFTEIPGLKQVEVNKSTTIKMILRDSDDLSRSSREGDDRHHNHHVVKINMDDHMQGPDTPEVQEQHGDADEQTTLTPPQPPQPPASPSHTLSLKSPCGDGDGDDGSTSHCCHDHPEVKFTCSGEASFGIRYVEETIRPASYSAPPPPYYTHPFAPPPNYYVNRGPPSPAAYTPPYDVYFGKDNRDCSVM